MESKIKIITINNMEHIINNMKKIFAPINIVNEIIDTKVSKEQPTDQDIGDIWLIESERHSDIIIDNIPLAFEELKDGGTYPIGTILTIEEGATLTINDEVAELVNNTYTFEVFMENLQLSLIDKTGNVSSVSININSNLEHEHNFVDEVCTICGKSEYEDFHLKWNTIHKTGLVPSVDNLSLDDNVIIPATFKFEGTKYKTTHIEMALDDRFGDASNVTSLTIPNTVTKISALNAFMNVESLTIPESVKELAVSIIYPGENMKTVYVNSMFNHCRYSFVCNDNTLNLYNRYELILGENIKDLQFMYDYDRYFGSNGGDYSIESIKIEGPVITIPAQIFSNLHNLKTVILPNTIKNIGSNAFYNCNNLSLMLPDTIENIGENAFYNVGHISYFGTLTSSNNWGALSIN